MKTKIITLAVIATIGAGLLFAFRQDSSKKVVTLNIFTGAAGRIVTIDENGNEQVDEEIPSLGISSKKNHIDFSKKIHAKFNELYGKGYEIVNSNGGIGCSIYVFEKD